MNLKHKSDINICDPLYIVYSSYNENFECHTIVRKYRNNN